MYEQCTHKRPSSLDSIASNRITALRATVYPPCMADLTANASASSLSHMTKMNPQLCLISRKFNQYDACDYGSHNECEKEIDSY